MRLHRHDELVEAMAMVLPRKGHRDLDYINARDALDALLEAVVKLGVGKNAVAWPAGTKWSATSNANSYSPTAGEFLALILRMEAHDDE